MDSFGCGRNESLENETIRPEHHVRDPEAIETDIFGPLGECYNVTSSHTRGVISASTVSNTLSPASPSTSR